MALGSALYPAVISTYRCSLRTIRSIPNPMVRSKLAYNIRELFDIYRDESDPSKIDQFLVEARHDLELMGRILRSDPTLVEELFKNFEPFSKAPTDPIAASKNGNNPAYYQAI